jgi:hypothetical protein
MNPIALVRTRITSLCSCFCVLVFDPRFRDEECIFMRQLVDFSRQVVDDEECLAWNLRYNLK